MKVVSIDFDEKNEKRKLLKSIINQYDKGNINKNLEVKVNNVFIKNSDVFDYLKNNQLDINQISTIINKNNSIENFLYTLKSPNELNKINNIRNSRVPKWIT